MNIPVIWKRASKAAADNAPTILTAIGVTGALTTAILASKASFKAAEIISEEQSAHDEVSRPDLFTLKGQAKLVWPQYIPAAVSAALTVSAIVCSNRISTKRAAALASAYTVSQEIFERYKDKVAETLGKDKEQKVRDEVAKDVVLQNPPPAMLVVSGSKDCWVHDEYTDRWFKSSHEALERAAIDINYQIVNEGSATLSDFWKLLGVTHAAVYDAIGWNNSRKLEISIGSTIMEDKTLALTLDFLTVPVREYSSSY